MKTFLVVFAFLSISCSTLPDAKIDHHLRTEGEYRCEATGTTAKGRKKADKRTQARCYRDSIRIAGTSFRVGRVFYQDDSCQSNPLGVVTREGTIEELVTEADGSKSRFRSRVIGGGELVRTDPEWLSEAEGRCPLKGYQIGEKTPIRVGDPCASLLPVIADQWTVFRDSKGGNAAAEKLIAASRASVPCSRY